MRKIEKMAKKIIRENLFLKQSETLIIHSGPKALEFAEELAYQASLIGAHSFIIYSSSKLRYKIFRDINEKHLKKISSLNKFITKKIDAEIILDDSDPLTESKIPQKKIEIRRKTLLPLRRIRDKRITSKDVKIALLWYPTEEAAESIGISFKKLWKIYWNCLDIDYNALYQYNRKLVSALKKGEKIKIYGKETELELSVKNRPVHNACGLWEKEKMGFLNLPDGEVFCAPLESSVNGEIYLDLPCMWHFGKKVKGVWFKFRNGKLVSYSIEDGEKDFEDVIKNASGRKDYIGELGIGTNPKAKITGGIIIIDEKVRGTIHIALGNNISFGGRNEATIHWDFFKDMKKKSEIYAGEKLIMKNGNFVG